MKNRVKAFFQSFLPIIISLGLEFLVTIAVIEIISVLVLFNGGFSNSSSVINEFYSFFSTFGFTAIVSIAYSASCIIIFGVWYRHLLRLDNATGKIRLPFKIIFPIAIMAFVLQYASDFLIGVVEYVLPGSLSQYQQLVESSGIGSTDSILMVIYGVILAPIGEELIFRGVTLKYTHRAFPFWVANVFQALLFGVMHMNFVQGSYAFMLGIFLGFIYYKSGSIKASILFHVAFNLIGTFLSPFLPSLPEMSDTLEIIVFAVLIFVSILCCIWFSKMLIPRHERKLKGAGQ